MYSMAQYPENHKHQPYLNKYVTSSPMDIELQNTFGEYCDLIMFKHIICNVIIYNINKMLLKDNKYKQDDCPYGMQIMIETMSNIGSIGNHKFAELSFESLKMTNTVVTFSSVNYLLCI